MAELALLAPGFALKAPWVRGCPAETNNAFLRQTERTNPKDKEEGSLR